MRLRRRKTMLEDDHDAAITRVRKNVRVKVIVVLAVLLVLFLKPELWPTLANALELLRV